MNIVFVPHSHWDREWYSPLEVFRMRLAELVETLLSILETEPEYRCFVLDGQTVALEDYLHLYPERRETLARLVREKRLRLGPWYTQPDEFLVSGESLVRNLLMGRAVAQSFGDWMAIGYCPDSFGHVGQLPQILKGFGIDHAIFTRGMGDEPRSTEYWWKGADGTVVLATCLLHAYSNAGRLPEDCDEAEKRIRDELEWIGADHATQYVLMNQGGDHYTPQSFLVRFAEHLRGRDGIESVVIGHFETYSQRVKALDLAHLPRIAGTLRGSKHYPILRGVLSSRRDIKARNDEAERLLLRWAEPFAAIAGLFTPIPYSAPLREAWKLLLQNHAHDTICGCSIDAVGRETLLRFEKVMQTGEKIKKDALEKLFSLMEIPAPACEDDRAYVVMNPLAAPRSAPVAITVTEPAEELVTGFVVRDAAGRELPTQILSTIERQACHPEPSRQRQRDTTLVFVAERVPGLGGSPYFVAAAPLCVGNARIKRSAVIENEFFRVGLEKDGTVTVVDLRSGRVLSGLCAFEDDGDEGDSYNFSPVPGDRALRQPLRKIARSVTADGPVQKTLRLTGSLALPAGISGDRTSRVASTVYCPVTMEVALYAGVPRVEVTVTVENRARDHRLRMAFPLDGRCLEARTGEAFDLAPVPAQPDGDDWIERPCGSWPMTDLVHMTGTGGSLAIVAEGVREMELRHDSSRPETLLTLLRCVGWMSREDNAYRRPEAGPKIATPDGQMEGVHVFRLALWPHAAEERDAATAVASACLAPLEAFPVTPGGGRLPSGASLVSIAPQELVLSALKRREHGDSLVARLYNPTDAPRNVEVSAAFPLKGCRTMSLAEEPSGEMLPPGAPIPLGPRGILTVELIPDLS